MNFKKIITHDGIFHADEILAIAFLRYYSFVSLGNFEIERKREITEDEFNDPTILILDVGQKYDPKKGNFDHHQDKELEATNVLVLRHFLSSRGDLVEKLYFSLFGYVSDIDKGIRSKKGESAGFNAIIKSFNIEKGGFHRAINLAETILNQYSLNAKSSIESEKAWKNFERISDGRIVVMKKDDPFVSDWKRIGQEEGVQLLVCPNQKNEGFYNIISRDTDIVKIHEHPNQTFLHNSQFFAIYGAYECAITHAQEMVK